MPRLILTTAPSADVLERVACQLRRRRCVVTAASYSGADAHRPGRLELTYECLGGRPGQVAAWVAGLVDVLEVETEPALRAVG